MKDMFATILRQTLTPAPARSENPSNAATVWWAVGAAAAAIAVTSVVMINRRNMAMDVCSTIGQIGGAA